MAKLTHLPKRRKISSAGSDCSMSEEKVTVVPVLADLVTAPISVVSVFVSKILDKKKTSTILKQLSNVYPLQGLSHIKRVRKQVINDGEKKEELQIILCETSKMAPQCDEETSLKHIFADVQHIDVGFLGEPFIASVAKVAPSTRAQFEEASKHWPTAFHDDKELSRIISGELFSDEDRINIYRHITEATDLTKTRIGDSKQAVGAVIVDPKTDTILARACSSSSRDHPLHHAVMKCVDLVAHSQGGGAWSLCPGDSYEPVDMESGSGDGPYLCTGYDLFISQEPCIMCAMALVHSRIRRVFYLHSHPEGALGSKYKLHAQPGLNHRYQVFKVIPTQQSQTLDHR